MIKNKVLDSFTAIDGRSLRKIKNKEDNNSHNELKVSAKKFLMSLGFDSTEIFTEYSITIPNNRTFIVDVVGIHEAGLLQKEYKIAIECGHTDETKTVVLGLLFDKLFIFPFNLEVIYPESLDIIIKKQEKINSLEKEKQELESKIKTLEDKHTTYQRDMENIDDLKFFISTLYNAIGVDRNGYAVGKDDYLFGNKSRAVLEFAKRIRHIYGADLNDKIKKIEENIIATNEIE